MKNSFIIVVLLLFSQLFFCQEKERKILRGKIVADSIEVENLTVFNITSNIGAVTNIDGKFSFYNPNTKYGESKMIYEILLTTSASSNLRNSKEAK